MKPTFAPHLFIKNVSDAIEFYRKAFQATELRRWSNADGSVHVAEMTMGDAMFHLHEEVLRAGQLSPQTVKATTSLIGVFAPDPDQLFNDAIANGGTVVNAMEDFDYGYRQGTVSDPFGHQWLLQKKIP